jgi:hypothetical protein
MKITNRSQCPFCRSEHRRKMLLRKERHYRNKRYQAALKAAKESGKVVQVWKQDAFTGWHFIDYKGQQEITGYGRGA